MKIHQFSAIIAFALFLGVISAKAAPWSGSGTSDDPYEIWNASDLNAIGADANYYSSNFKMMADIDLAGIIYTDAVIPYAGAGFTGVFDGNTHIISNLTIDTAGADTDYLGLFGVLDSDAILKDVGIENVLITGGNSSSEIGALAGGNAGTIQECFARGIITGGSGSNDVGGLVGLNGSIIQDCYADVNVTNLGVYTGGAIGLCAGIASNCYASGYINGGSAVGGFAGYAFYTFYILNCCYLRLSDGGGPNNGIGIELTAAEMRLQSSFVNWDFFGEADNGTKEVWEMDVYPILSWQSPVGLREFGMLAKFWPEPNCQTGELCSTVDWYTDGQIDFNDLNQLCKSWLCSRVVSYYPINGDDFETGDFSAQPWVQTGDANWIIDTNTVFEGTYSAKSGAISDSQTSTIEFTTDTGDCELISFYYKVSSEEGFDGLNFYIDGDSKIIGGLSGELGWSEMTFNFTPGVRTFKWTYFKDSSGSDGSDCAWLDYIRILKLEE